MGLIRKTIAGSLAIGTGGLSLGAVQWRSDTERVAHQTKLLREEMERANEVARQGLVEAQKQNAQIQNQIAHAEAAKTQAIALGTPMNSTVTSPNPTSTPLSIASALSRLHGLQGRGLLSPDEYMSKKSELLAILNS